MKGDSPFHSMGTFEPLGRESAVSSLAIDRLKEMIVAGDLKAGQRLPPERDLALLLRVSRPSLREAIRALTALNIVQSRHGDGTYVSSLEPELLARPIDFLLQISHESVAALFEARRVVEAGVASFAALRASELELAQLDDFVKVGRSLVDDVVEFVHHDIAFHARLLASAQSPILSSLVSSLSTLAADLQSEAAQDDELRAASLRDHQRIVRALRSRDATLAAEMMDSHLENMWRGVERVIDSANEQEAVRVTP